MPVESSKEVNVKCPFYCYDRDKSKIICEGPVDKSYITLSFRRRSDFNSHVEIFCCKNFQKCEIYRILMEKYEDDL